MGLLLRGKSYNEVIHQLQARLSQLGTHLNCGLRNEWSTSGWTSLNSGTTSIHVSCLEWNRQGGPFCTHAYVLETDPVTREEFHEGEDYGCLKKVYFTYVICQFWLNILVFSSRELLCAQEKKFQHNTEHYPKALKYPETWLTMSVLKGDRKQSVRDAEYSTLTSWSGIVLKGYTAECRIRKSCFGMVPCK